MKPPRKRIRMELEIEAHNFDDLAHKIRDFGTQILMGYWRGSGGFSAGHVSYSVKTDDLGEAGMTEEEYNAALAEWLETRDDDPRQDTLSHDPTEP